MDSGFAERSAARIMVKQSSGKIINIASMLSFQDRIIVPSYTAAKSGVAGITRALANEWARYHITVNITCYYFIKRSGKYDEQFSDN